MDICISVTKMLDVCVYIMAKINYSKSSSSASASVSSGDIKGDMDWIFQNQI